MDVGTLKTFRPGPLSHVGNEEIVFFFESGISDLLAWSFQGVV